MSNTILITGATGNIGAKLTAQILARPSGDRVVLLVRGHSDDQARQRMSSVLNSMPNAVGLDASSQRLEILAGDIAHPALGLDKQTYGRLSRMLTHIVHSAASTCFTLPLAAAREINVTGTAHVMKLAKRCLSQGRLKGVAHVSTAYVNGPSPHSICESTLDHREEFSNTYDRTKWEAERYVQSLQGELPLHVFRPSIVVGDSQTGHTSSFNVLYAPLRLIASEWVRTLPGYPQSLLDVVPSDYVTRAMDYILLQRPSIPGQTYHLVAGYSGSMTVSEVVAEATRVFGTRRARPPIRYLASGRMEQVLPGAGGNNVRVHEVLRVFAPFMTAHWSFDFAHTREALIGSGISCPPFDQYIQTCLEFCKRTNWGKHAILQTAGEIRVSDRGHRQPELPRRLAWELAPAS